MNNIIEISSNGYQDEEFEVKSPTDPTGADFEVSVTAPTATAPGSFTAGSWSGSWNSTTGLATGVTPTMGGAGATIDVSTPGDYKLWIRWTNTTSSPVAEYLLRAT